MALPTANGKLLFAACARGRRCQEFLSLSLQPFRRDASAPKPAHAVQQRSSAVVQLTNNVLMSLIVAVPVVPSWWMTMEAAALAISSASRMLAPAEREAVRLAVTA